MPDWLPGTGFKRIAAKWSEDYFSMVNTPFNMVVKGLVSLASVLNNGESLLRRHLERWNRKRFLYAQMVATRSYRDSDEVAQTYLE